MAEIVDTDVRATARVTLEVVVEMPQTWDGTEDLATVYRRGSYQAIESLTMGVEMMAGAGLVGIRVQEVAITCTRKVQDG